MTNPLAAIVLVALLSLGGCKQLFDAIAETARETNINGAPPPKRVPQAVATPEDAGAVTDLVKKASIPGGFDVDTPSGRLAQAIARRIACDSAPCEARVLAGINARRALYLPGLPALLVGQSDPVTIQAIRIAGLFHYAPAVPALSRVVMIGDGRLKMESTWALGQIGGVAAIPALDGLSQSDQPAPLAVAICRALGSIGSARGLPAIERVTRAGGPRVRAECVLAAGKTHDKAAVPLLDRALEDPAAEVVRAARLALRTIPGPRARRALRRAHMIRGRR